MRRILSFFRDQVAMMDLTKRVAQCARRGHSFQTIWFKGELRYCCSNCGRAE